MGWSNTPDMDRTSNQSENVQKTRAKVQGRFLQPQLSSNTLLILTPASQAAAKTMEHLSEFVFISMGNLTLARRDAYLSHLNSGD